MKKRYKKYKDLIRVSIANTTPPLTEDENICKNILILGGIKYPSKTLIKIAMEEAVRKIKK